MRRLILTAALAASAAYAVVADGRVPLTGDDAADRAAALADARRHAVEEAVGVMVNATVLLQNQLLVNDTVLTKAAGLVTNEVVTAEGPAGEFYQVTISCDVEPSLLATELDRLKRAVVVSVAEEKGAGGSRMVEGIMRERLAAAGFQVLDTAFLTAAGAGDKLPPAGAPPDVYQGLGRRYLAQVIIYGDVTTVDAGVVEDSTPYGGDNPLAGLKIARANGNLKAVDTSTGEIIAERQTRPGEVVGFGDDEAGAAADARARFAETFACYFEGALQP